MYRGPNGVGKGDKPRAIGISQKEFAKRWDAIFNKKKKEGKQSGRTEYDLKDQMIRNTIIETEKDVQEIKEEQKEMRTDVKNIERMLMQK